MSEKNNVTLFWMRRDLRLNDNTGLYQALLNNKNVIPLFIFDKNILNQLNPTDHRVTFIFDELQKMKSTLQELGSDLRIEYGIPLDIFKKIIADFNVKNVYTNHDYESYGIQRDSEINRFLDENKIEFNSYKDHVVFEKNEVLTDQKKPYTVFTPYKKKWLSLLKPKDLEIYDCKKLTHHFFKFKETTSVSLETMGFKKSTYNAPELKLSKTVLKNYESLRNFPFEFNGTSLLGLHLRFGTTSVRYLAAVGKLNSEVWLSELIWRDFFNQIIFHFPHSENKSFRNEYENIQWLDHKSDFEKWTLGMTGYPLVDAGMRELNATGHMHNRVRMVTASFLTKHLLHHWKKGERYFAEHLYDYDLSANVGNWQWAAGTGCDAAPYFRIFNPTTQQEKFDPDFIYIKKWIPEFGTNRYPLPMIEHTVARDRCLKAYKTGLGKI